MLSPAPLPADEFKRRHRGLVILLLAHLVALPTFGLLMGWSLGASLLVIAPAAVFALAAASPRFPQTVQVISCVMGLLCCSAALVWLWRGQTEAHFHYFVIVGAVALYEEWLPYVIAFGFVVLQHGLMSLWVPRRVYGSMAAMQHPWLWAGIHGGFVAALALANVVSWRASERTRRREHRAVTEALDSARRLERAFAGAPNGAALLDRDGIIRTVNDALATSLRAPRHSLIGRRWIDLVSAPTAGDMPVVWPPASPGLDRERRVERTDGSEGWLLVTYSLLSDDASGDAEWIAQTIDVTRRRHAEAQLAFAASHDSLTGLVNRHTFAAQAQQILQSRTHAAMCVLFADIDDFKIVNDSLGHDAGDALLISIADRLRSITRKDDLIGRFGGDEFVICLADPFPDDAETAAQRVVAAFAQPFILQGVERTVSVSVGLALARADEHSVDSLLRDADLAMYEAKTAGKARHVWFDIEMRHRAIDRLELEADLRTAVADRQIDTHYQPQVDLDGTLVGLEALARWDHPTRGPISPVDFIPIAERSSLVGAISEHVLRRACQTAQLWESPAALPGRSVDLDQHLAPLHP